MANYLFLFRGGNTRDMSPEELQQHLGKWAAWSRDLSRQGVFKGGEPLGPAGRVMTGKKQAITDGPFGETKDVVGGYIVVVAPNLDAATELARGCPIFLSDGSLEVRELQEMKM
jgi:hypothetical protein